MALDSNEHEFEEFFRRQHRSLVAYVSRRTATGADAEEIAQESCIKLLGYGSIDTRPEKVWKALLYRIAANLAVDQHRKTKRGPAYVDVRVHEDSLHCGLPEPYDFASAREELLAIRNTLMQISPRTRRIFLLSRAHEKTYREIATICGVSIKTVEKHVSRALRVLK